MKEREYGFDILKIILVLMILIHHFLVHALGLKEISYNFTYEYKLGYFLLNAFCIAAVNVFFIISGYFKVRFKPLRFIFMYISCSIAVLFWFLYSTKDEEILVSWDVVKVILFPVKEYWFMGAYFVLLLLAPFLNKGLKALSYKELIGLSCILAFINYFCGFYMDIIYVGNGYSIFQAITMYITGSAIRGYILHIKEDDTKKGYLLFRNLSIIFYIGLSLFIGYAAYLLMLKKNYVYGPKMFWYNNPLVYISSILLFLFFTERKWNYKGIRILAYCTQFSLFAYIWTDTTFSREILYEKFLLKIEGLSTKETIGYIFIYAVSIYISIMLICTLVHTIVLLCKKYILPKRLEE